MADSRRRNLVALAVVAVVVVTAVVLAFAVGYFVPNRSPSPTPASEPRTYLNLTIAYDPKTETGNYTTPFISVVANTLVVATITNYDPSASPLFVPWDNHVIGTVGGNETVDCGNGVESVSSLPSTGISHTFTVLDAYYNISIPVPPAPSPAVPCVVTFELTMNQGEITSWGCVANCDNGQMAAGRMWGLLLITG
ncbi:MAG: hypothetical protein WAN74_00800 [Thermoplasmata archaeon]